jgi:hypothetical protein
VLSEGRQCSGRSEAGMNYTFNLGRNHRVNRGGPGLHGRLGVSARVIQVPLGVDVANDEDLVSREQECSCFGACCGDLGSMSGVCLVFSRAYIDFALMTHHDPEATGSFVFYFLLSSCHSGQCLHLTALQYLCYHQRRLLDLFFIYHTQ